MSTKPMSPAPDEAQSVGADQPRFCSSCGRTKPILGGALVRCANGAKRWKCADCRARSKAHLAALQHNQAQLIKNRTG